jgi:hypothetical protein
VPKTDDLQPRSAEDDDVLIDVVVEGNALSVAEARDEITKIVNERTATVSSKIRSIPAEYYHFIAGPHNKRVNELEESKGVQIRIPPYHTWTAQPPPQKPANGQPPKFQPAAGDNHITVAGDRAGAIAARNEIEQLARELERQLTVDQFPMNRGRHQFIIGNRGIPAPDFFAETGCAIILPGDSDDDTITIVGPPERIEAARDRAVDLAASMQSSSIDISRQHRNAPGGASVHARNVTQYLRQRNAIEELEKLHRAHIVTSFTQEGGAAPWELYSRDYKNAVNAQTEITKIVNAHPPSRFSAIPVDPFFHSYLKSDITPRVRKDYGVHVVIPQPSDTDSPVILVFEGDAGLEPEYQVPRDQPSNEDILAFQRGLEDARNHILQIIKAQAEIKITPIDVPTM